MGQYRDDFGEPWSARRSEMLPYTIHPLEDDQAEVDAIRVQAKADPRLGNWLVWGRAVAGQCIVAFTKPSKSRVGHEKLAKRIVKCVNAMAGIEDPEAVMAKVRGALDAIWRAETPEDVERAKDKALIARTYLEPKPKEPTSWWEH